MIVIDQPHDLSADDEATLVAYVDGNLEPDERGRVEARAAEDPSFAAALALQQQGRDAILTASESTGAPLALRASVESAGGARGAATGTAGRPHAPGSGGSGGRVRGWWPARSPSLSPPSCSSAAARASRTSRPPPSGRRPPRWPPSRRPRSCWTRRSAPSPSPTTRASSAGRRWGRAPTRSTAATPARSSTRRTASGSPTPWSTATRCSKPDDADKATREGTELRSLTTSDDRTVVTWERNGQTCVLSVVEGRRLARRTARARRLEGHGRGPVLDHGSLTAGFAPWANTR